MASEGAAAKPEYRIALRPDEAGELDDVVVKDVEMFRAEMMDDRTLWMCCYLAGHERVNFWVSARGGKLRFSVTEWPDDVPYEAGSIGATDAAGRSCGADITIRDEEHRPVLCEKAPGHTDAHEGEGVIWTSG